MDSELPFRITLLALIAIGVPITAYYRIKADKAGGKISRARSRLRSGGPSTASGSPSWGSFSPT